MQSSDSPLNSFIGNAFCPRELDIFFFHTILCKPEIDSSFFPRGHIRKLQMFWRVLLNNHYKLVLVRVCVTINQLIIIISSGIKKVFWFRLNCEMGLVETPAFHHYLINTPKNKCEQIVHVFCKTSNTFNSVFDVNIRIKIRFRMSEVEKWNTMDKWSSLREDLHLDLCGSSSFLKEEQKSSRAWSALPVVQQTVCDSLLLRCSL